MSCPIGAIDFPAPRVSSSSLLLGQQQLSIAITKDNGFTGTSKFPRYDAILPCEPHLGPNHLNLIAGSILQLLAVENSYRRQVNLDQLVCGFNHQMATEFEFTYRTVEVLYLSYHTLDGDLI